MKDYFISVDFYNKEICKFASSIVNLDVKETKIIDVAKCLIKPECSRLGVSVDDVTIKIVSFNLV